MLTSDDTFGCARKSTISIHKIFNYCLPESMTYEMLVQYLTPADEVVISSLFSSGDEALARAFIFDRLATSYKAQDLTDGDAASVCEKKPANDMRSAIDAKSVQRPTAGKSLSYCPESNATAWEPHPNNAFSMSLVEEYLCSICMASYFYQNDAEILQHSESLTPVEYCYMAAGLSCVYRFKGHLLHINKEQERNISFVDFLTMLNFDLLFSTMLSLRQIILGDLIHSSPCGKKSDSRASQHGLGLAVFNATVSILRQKIALDGLHSCFNSRKDNRLIALSFVVARAQSIATKTLLSDSEVTC